MKKIAIVYASKHHGNTLKLVDTISERYPITQIDAEKQHDTDLSGYDLIGFASGIDFGRFYDSVVEFLRKNLPEKKPVFFLYTCAMQSRRFSESIEKEAVKKGAVVLGEYGCKGYNTYGPWKLIGGMNRKHPTAEEQKGAVSFFEALLKSI